MLDIEILYAETLNNCIKCNMDKPTIINLKEMYNSHLQNHWANFENTLIKLNNHYKAQIKESNI